MNLTTLFEHSFLYSDNLVKLYESLVTKNKKNARADWIDRLYKSKVIRWPRKNGIWRSSGSNILVIGNKDAQLIQSDFSSDSLLILLKTALVLAMAAVDKILHEAIIKDFVHLVKSGALDKIIELPLSDSYNIALLSRKRTGQGGKTKTRPSHLIKHLVLEKLYTKSFLATRLLEEICSSCGVSSIFKEFATEKNKKEVDIIKKHWSSIYQKRNHIAHECDIIRKEKTKKIHFHKAEPQKLIDDIHFVEAFGIFVAEKLNAGSGL